MPYQTLLSPAVLFAHLGDPDWAIIDCRFYLSDTEKGVAEYIKGHVPGALYAHLDHDLSGMVEPGKTGRHPLPPIESFADSLSRWGIDDSVQVVAYDDMGGAIAARLWWMLRWLGHNQVAVLDGGWSRWIREAFPVNTEVSERTARLFKPNVQEDLIITSDEVMDLVSSKSGCLLDARSKERYDGFREPIDPIAGHIPTAKSAPFSTNLDDSGQFKTPDELRMQFVQKAGQSNLDACSCYCGSGITAAHNLLALAHAGFPAARLYPGSWSEWITDPARPIAQN